MLLVKGQEQLQNKGRQVHCGWMTWRKMWQRWSWGRVATSLVET